MSVISNSSDEAEHVDVWRNLDVDEHQVEQCLHFHLSLDDDHRVSGSGDKGGGVWQVLFPNEPQHESCINEPSIEEPCKRRSLRGKQLQSETAKRCMFPAPEREMLAKFRKPA